MSVAINGSGTITGISVGGLPDATVTPAELTQPLTFGTAQASTSGTNIDFTGIPSWVKRITVMFAGVSTSGTSNYLVQIGDSGGIENTGYDSAASSVGVVVNGTTGFAITSGTIAAGNFSGKQMIEQLNGNLWVSSSSIVSQALGTSVGAGQKTLSGTLDRVRITTVNGTDTFDAGSINILYE